MKGTDERYRRISDGERGRISKRKFSLNEIHGKERRFLLLLER
jgi:hypothetical protein